MESDIYSWLVVTGVGYDGIEEFIPALMDLIQSRLDSSRGKDSDKNVVRLETASAFYHPPIRETVTGNHAVPAANAERLSVNARFVEDHLKLSNGSMSSSPPRYSCAGAIDGPYYAEPEPFVALSGGHDFQSHFSGGTSNGIV